MQDHVHHMPVRYRTSHFKCHALRVEAAHDTWSGLSQSIVDRANVIDEWLKATSGLS